MATGRRSFEGKTRTSLIAAIVSSQPPPISKVQPLTPPALEHVVECCLEKEPDARWQTARDIAEKLKWISSKGSQIGVPAPIVAHRRSRERLSWALVPVLVTAAVAGTWGVIRFRAEPQRVQTSILPPDKNEYASAQRDAPAISCYDRSQRELREAEVEQLHAALGQHDVAGLEIAVNDVLTVRRI